MNKRVSTLICALMLVFVLATACACSFFDEEERREIENIYYLEATQDEKEGIMVIIEYVGEDYPDSMFFLPNGEEGEEGNGISDVQAQLTEDGSHIQITVNYTDKTRDPSVFTFENSVFPTDFQSTLDETTGDWLITVTLSNGDTNRFTLHNGVDGQDGDTVTNITTEEDEDGVTWIVITLSSTDEEGNPTTYRFPMPNGDKGDQGVGILDVYVDTYLTAGDPYNIHLVIILSDNSQHDVEIPKTNNWSVTDTGEKPAESSGSLGDFVFDKKTYTIWYKGYTGWEKIMDLSDKQADTHEVRFVADGLQVGKTRYVTHGSYFATQDDPMPDVSKEGFTFAGWYTEPCDPATGAVPPNADHFTDLTYVLGNLTLYARFIPDAA